LETASITKIIFVILANQDPKDLIR
jgi:hypothetical protein